LDVRRLRVLRQVAHDGSFAAAARSLHLTRPAVSQQLAALEREAGVRLVEREGRGIRLTDAAWTLVAHADTVLAQLEAAAADLEVADGRHGGELRCAAFPSAASRLLAPACAALARAHPALRVRARQLEPDAAMSALAAGELDLAVAHAYDRVPRRIAASLTVQTLLREPLLIALPGHDSRAAAETLMLAEFADDRWIAPPADMTCAEQLVRACAGVGFEPIVTSRACDYDVVLAFVAAGLGVGLVPTLAAHQAPPGVALRRLDEPSLERHVFAAVRRGAAARPALRVTIDALVESASDALEAFVGAATPL
jgi:DNA-binding transcriptional LysR family regulator